MSTSLSAADVVQRLVEATNAHDLEALVGCFSEDYVNETPAHPGRGFTGREQVRVNWTHIFAAVPDIRLQLVGQVAVGSTVWCEQEMAGTRRDGSAHLMRGVVIFCVRDEQLASARFFLEPVEQASGDVHDAVRALTSPRE